MALEAIAFLTRSVGREEKKKEKEKQRLRVVAKQKASGSSNDSTALARDVWSWCSREVVAARGAGPLNLALCPRT
jgi:hypothetical protein